MARVNVILVAGGQSRRFGGDVPKQFLTLAGRSVLAVTASRFVGVPGLTRVVVVAAPEHRARIQSELESLDLPLHFAPAGAERQDSVARGLGAVEAACDVVVVHDAVRPLVTPATIAASIAAAEATGAALVATPVADTVKQARDGRVVTTVPRHDLWLAQTPQAFRVEILRRAHADAARAGVTATDDAALVERLGLPVAIVPGDASNRKITKPEDLAWAEAALAVAR